MRVTGHTQVTHWFRAGPRAMASPALDPTADQPRDLRPLLGLAWPGASLSLSADIHLNVPNNSYDRIYL